MVVDYLAAGREDDRFDWNVPAGLFPRLSGDLHQSPAAGDFHDEHGQRIDFRSIDHFRQFADVGLRVAVELRTCDCQRFPAQETIVEIPAGKSGAIGRQQQVGIPEEPGLRLSGNDGAGDQVAASRIRSGPGTKRRSVRGVTMF